MIGPESMPDSQATGSVRGPVFVLVVEDEKADFDMVVRGLLRSGIHAHCLRVDTEEAYRSQVQTRPDIILSDYVLPSFSALRALQLLEESGLDIPLIVLTGMVSEETVAECMERGASDYLLKDRLTRLGPAVRRALQEQDLRFEKKCAEANATQSELDLQESERQLRETHEQLIRNEEMASLGQVVAGTGEETDNPLAFLVTNLLLVENRQEEEGLDRVKRTVLMKLIANAVDAIVGAGAGDGKTVITTSQTPDSFLISVRDNGAGLGLAISNGIVQDYAGSIEVRSEAGGGSEFIVTIPLNLKLQRVQAWKNY
jgi:C4-dicarboxylate-specific signal transduction histidine kinase